MRVFVSVGNLETPFSRLLDAVEREVRGGELRGAEVVVQSGHTPFHSDICVVHPFLPPDEFRRGIDAADLVLAHAGAGVIIQSIVLGKAVVAVPRRASLREHLDDHQVELARALASQGRIVAAEDVSDLGSAIAEARRRGKRSESNGHSQLLSGVARSLRELC